MGPRPSTLDWLSWFLLGVMAVGALRMGWTFAVETVRALQGFAS